MVLQTARIPAPVVASGVIAVTQKGRVRTPASGEVLEFPLAALASSETAPRGLFDN